MQLKGHTVFINMHTHILIAKFRVLSNFFLIVLIIQLHWKIIEPTENSVDFIDLIQDISQLEQKTDSQGKMTGAHCELRNSDDSFLLQHLSHQVAEKKTEFPHILSYFQPTIDDNNDFITRNRKFCTRFGFCEKYKTRVEKLNTLTEYSASSLDKETTLTFRFRLNLFLD